MKKVIFILIAAFSIFFTSCSSLITPDDEENTTLSFNASNTVKKHSAMCAFVFAPFVKRKDDNQLDYQIPTKKTH